MFNKFIILLVTFCFTTININAQIKNLLKKSEDAENIMKAEYYLQEGKFEKALLLYKRMYNKKPKSPKINFLLGYAYLNTGYGHEKALHYLLQSVALKTDTVAEQAPLEMYYYIALAYYQNKQYETSISYLDTLLNKIPVKEAVFLAQTKQLKEHCYNAKMFAQSSINLDEDNLYELNSKYSDKNPLIFNNGTEIIFTSQRETLRRNKGVLEKTTDDNIYYSIKENGKWSNPMNLSNLNTPYDETACWISQDGSFMIIRRDDKNRSNIYFTERNQYNEWSKPKPFAEPVNSKYNETYGSLSPDGKTIFFTSDRKGGYGGLDIYSSKRLGKNKWSAPVNIGSEVNTKYSEESPMMHENGVLFFCTEGHVSMGGFDIFTSSQDNKGKWKRPGNLGDPINTINDDFFFQVMPHGQYAYTSSGRKGTKGFSDIFKFYINDSSKRGYALVSGKINCSGKIDFTNDILIKIKNTANLDNEKSYQTNRHGYFSIILPAGAEYKVSYLYNNTEFYKARLIIPKSYSFLANEQSVRIKNIDLTIDSASQKPKMISPEVYKSDERTTEEIKKGRQLIEKERQRTNNSNREGNNNKQNQSNNALTKVYSIKIIGNTKIRQDLSAFPKLNNVVENINKDGTYTYYIGRYEYEWEALIKLKLIREDYPDASVFVNNVK